MKYVRMQFMHLNETPWECYCNGVDESFVQADENQEKLLFSCELIQGGKVRLWYK